MITVAEAKRTADGVGTELKEISETIKNASMKGEYEVCLAARKEFLETVVDQLSKAGFTHSYEDNGAFDLDLGSIVDLTIKWK